ncbi:hypothetical protein JCM1841_003808 [Sporobolomyces salmonicolor]
MPNNSYIVVFKDEDSFEGHLNACTEKVEQSGGEIKHRYASRVMKGFSATMDEKTKTELESHPGVKYIEPDAAVSTM